MAQEGRALECLLTPLISKEEEGLVNEWMYRMMHDCKVVVNNNSVLLLDKVCMTLGYRIVSNLVFYIETKTF